MSLNINLTIIKHNVSQPLLALSGPLWWALRH